MKTSVTHRIVWRIAAAAAAAVALAACARKPVAERPPQPGDRRVASVDSASIWTSDVQREAVAEGLIGQGEPLDLTSPLFRQALDEVIDQRLLAGEALRRRLDRDPAAQGRLAAARERVLGDLLLESAVGKSIDEKAIDGLYQEMVNNETPTEAIRLRRIVLASEADALQVRGLLAKGGAFDALAAERSRDDATRFKGGEMPPGTVDMLPAPYARALAGAKAGQIVGPFKADEGWVIARVDDRHRETPITLDVARPQIIRYLTYDQVKDLILTLRQKAKVATYVGPPAGDMPQEPASAPAAAPSPPAPAPVAAPQSKDPRT
jgi:peptidyl-prolyl cis-trans isomerase C